MLRGTAIHTLFTRRLGLALVFAVGVLAPAVLPSAAAASGTLDCNGGTIYVVGRASSNGVVYALDASSVGGSSATLTQITNMPAGSVPNALGVTSNGLYAVDQTGSSANVWTFDAASSTWTSHPGSGTDTSAFVAGAVDPANGIYYYAAYSGTTATLYGFDTATNTAIPGTIGTFTLPGGASGNGDLTFDGAGNMYVLASDGTTRAVGVIHASEIPTTGTGATLTDTVLSAISDSSTYNGIAFDNLGRLYIEGSTGGNYGVTQIDPNDGHTIAGPTAYSTQATSPYVDLASCASIPTLSAQLNVSGRINPTDQFTLSITGGTISQGNTATSSGSTTGVQPQVAGPVIASSGTAYTFTETGASGANLANYDVTYSCVDGNNNNASIASGSGSSFTLNFPTVTLGQATPPPGIVCSFATTPKADLALTDSVTPSSAPHGTQVTYTLTATDNGPASATGVNLDDTLPSGVNVVSATPSQGTCSTTSGVNCSLGTLANSASATVTVVATVSNAASGTQTDSASVSANEYDPVSSNNTASASFSAAPAADMSLTDSVAPSSAPHGTQVTYTLTATNNGPDTATSASLTDTLPSGVSVVSATPSQGTCSTTSGVNCSLGTLPNNASATVTVVATVANGASGTQSDSASVGATEYDPVSSNNTATASFTPVPAADLALTDSAAPTTVLAGGQVTYTLTLANHGPDAATGAQILDSLPSGLTLVSATPSQGSCSTTSGVTCTIGDVANGDSVTVTVVAAVSASASGLLSDAASASAGDADPNSANNSATSPITVDPAADLGVTDSVSPATVTAGGQVTYTLTVTNHGPDTAHSAALTDTLPAGLSAVSATPSQGTCSTTSGLSCALGTIASGASVTVSLTSRVADGASGPLSDAAHTSATEADPVSANNDASATVQATAPPAAPPPPTAVSAAGPPTTDVQVTTRVDHTVARIGQVLTYTITVTNRGPAGAPAVQLTSQPSASLALLSVRSTQGSCTRGGSVHCLLGTVPAGQTVKVTVRALQRRSGAAVLSADATVGCDATGHCPTDSNPDNNASTAEARIRPYLRLSETVAQPTLRAGQEVALKLTLTNPTGGELGHARVCAQLPLGLSYVRSSRRPTLSDGRLCWSLGTVGGHRARTITVIVRALPGAKGAVTPTAQAVADGASPARAHRRVTIVAAPATAEAPVTG